MSFGKKLVIIRQRRPKWTVQPRILLCPQVPKPLHGVAPRVVLGNKWWNTTRKEAYRSTNYHCLACGISKHNAAYRQWLEAHEFYEIDYLLGRAEYIHTVPLCHLCHNYIHCGRLQSLLDKRLIPQGKYVAVIQHGNRILLEAKLKKEAYNGPFAEWEDWRMVINGREYPPLYKTPEEWEKVYG